MIAQENHCTVLERVKWINPVIQRHTEKGDQIFRRAQLVALEVQHLGKVLPRRRKINFIDDPKVLNKLVSSFIWCLSWQYKYGISTSRGYMMTYLKGFVSHLISYWGRLGDCFFGSFSSFLGCALILLPMSMGFVA